MTDLSLTSLSTDLLLEIVSYANCKSLAHLSQASKLLFLMSAETSHRPSFTAVNGPILELPDRAKEKLITPPTAGFLFTHTSVTSTHITQALEQLPKNLELIGGGVTHPLMADEEHGLVRSSQLNRGTGVLNLACLPYAHVRTFLPRPQQLRKVAFSSSPDNHPEILHILGLDPSVPYSVFVILSNASPDIVKNTLNAIQRTYPDCGIVGGMVMKAVYQWAKGALTMIERGGLVGMALAGNVPLQAFISRGVVPRSPAVRVVDWQYDARNELIVVERVQVNGAGGGGGGAVAAAASSASSMSAYQAINHFNVSSFQDLFIGLREGGEGQPFSLIDFEFVEQGGHVRLYLSVNAPPSPGAQLALGFFKLETDSCIAHVKSKMRQVSQEMTAKGQDLLGALLFSCNGRGPTSFLDVRTNDIDAQAFHDAFPKKALGGFYAAGELGPQAVVYLDEARTPTAASSSAAAAAASNAEGGGDESVVGPTEADHQVIMSCSQTGQAALQGFTAVFGLFIVPRRKRSGASSPLMEQMRKEGTDATVRGVMAGRGKNG